MQTNKRPSVFVAPLLGLLFAGFGLGARAQSAVTPEGAAAPAAAVSRTSAAPRPAESDRVTVIEDDGARIEETRRRGQVVRIQVQSKVANAKGYDITVKPSAESASQQRGNAGRSAWQLLSF